MTTYLRLNYCAYSNCFCKIYDLVILQLSGMKIAIQNHSAEKKKNSSHFFGNIINCISELERWKNAGLFLEKSHTYCKRLWSCLALNITLFWNLLFYTSSLPKVFKVIFHSIVLQM